jgi:uncharacterized protein YerC
MVELEAAFVAMKTRSETLAFLKMLLTDRELSQCRKRWSKCQMIAAGVPHWEIQKSLGGGIATISRAAKAVRDNPKIVRRLLRGGTNKKRVAK